MFANLQYRVAKFDNDAPRILVVVDTEEEFDWSKPHSRAETAVSHVEHLGRTQTIFERYGVKPVYVVDYPIASQEEAYHPLREWLLADKCRIGAHLHPWVNPPFSEELGPRNSYPGNLSKPIEEQKLKVLTETIATNFGEPPIFYRAGRYGIGPNTATILEALGYEIDSSVVPFTDFCADGGPDFSRMGPEPFSYGPSHRVLEIPLTVGWYGQWRNAAARLQASITSSAAQRLHLPGILARLGLLERIRLTPEGASYGELKRLTDMMLRSGQSLLVFSFHSPTVVPGHTPYVRNEAELQRFLGIIEQYCDYFCARCGGKGTTPEALAAAFREHPSHNTDRHGLVSQA